MRSPAQPHPAPEDRVDDGPDDRIALSALRAYNERSLLGDPSPVAGRRQVAVVRALADEVQRNLVRGAAVTTLREQLVEELARLGGHDPRRSVE